MFNIKPREPIRFLINSLLVVTALTACSTYPDKNIDPAKNNKTTFERDAIECAQAYPDANSGVHVRQRINCMKLKGWR
ncbi:MULTISPECIES: hypothetical protein [unclassified Polaromonas]|jgi:hypothetical protein|uniref:hypothetical protein n=1 Tax=unclassified Polaromonas TaxID=2638319 RepID=UPI000BCF6A61|nr:MULTISPECIES: hypothetical protein [unclassified Polaromonas]OYY57905.1 MAG: hypothetical protein B7Y55_03735 [Polynucleobacter sp. 35-46-207]OYZ76282.1 MAG: hypothetical protein B7Y09_21240 [Polaromonas sp. 24-63-21]OZA47502.1 MAG: hypothetical protein B7X88_21950 [Polaromonas sp. 17-63-33]OZB48056.1 MAG: hypothetical protein B7X60_04790 [Polynucleobacter sp. 39-45-136]